MAKEDALFTSTDRFEVLRQIGAGGMGVVYEVLDKVHRTRLALKILPKLDPAFLYRFKQEFRLLADLSHPNLVTLYELFSEGDNWFFTMQLVNGVSFNRYFHSTTIAKQDDDSTGEADDSTSMLPPKEPEPRATSTVQGPPPTEKTLLVPRRSLRNFPFAMLRRCLRDLIKGTSALHAAGLVHGDIKPSNVLVTAEGQIVLLDFGLIRELRPRPGFERETEIAGTLAYMSPEQAMGLPLTEASDWYSVGVMLYETLAGSPPFFGAPVRLIHAKRTMEPAPVANIADGVPADLNELCTALLQRNPTDRPTAAKILRILGAERSSFAGAAPRKTGSLFIGRQRQLATLYESFERVGRGEAVAAYVHGVSGIGKTSLVQRFLAGLSERSNIVILVGRCYERESVPYKALDSVIDALSRYLQKLPPEQLRSLLPDNVAALAQIFPVLREIADVGSPTYSPPSGAGMYEFRVVAFRALRELLTRIGKRCRLIIHIDDLQWGDVDSASLLLDLLRSPDPPGVFLLCCYRREYAQTSACLRMLFGSRDIPFASPVDVPVDALTFDEARSLAEEVLARADRRSPQLAVEIARECEGNPFFIVELAGQFGPESMSSISAEKHLAVDTVILHHIQQLKSDARVLLEVLAVASRPIRQMDAYAAAGLTSTDPASLVALRAGRLIRSAGSGETDVVEPYHDRIRETVLTALGPDELRNHHRALAHVLEASSYADAETLATHFDAGGMNDRCCEYYLKAADLAYETLAFDKATALYRRNLELQPVMNADQQRSIRIKLADALANAGRVYEAAQMYELAAEGSDIDLAQQLHRSAGFHYSSGGHVHEGREAFRKVLKPAGIRLPSTQWGSFLELGLERIRLSIQGLGFKERPESEIDRRVLNLIDILWAVGTGITFSDSANGWLFTSRTLRMALKAGEPWRIVRSLAWEVACVASISIAGQERAKKLLPFCEAVARRVNRPEAYGMLSMAEGFAEQHKGHWKESHELFSEAERILGRCKDVSWELFTVRLFKLHNLSYLGQYRTLREEAFELIRSAKERGDLYIESFVSVTRFVDVCLASNQPDEARAVMNEVMNRWSHTPYHLPYAVGAVYGALIDLYDGKPEAGLADVNRHWPFLKKHQHLRAITFRDPAIFIRMRLELSAAARSKKPEYLLKLAERDAKCLATEGLEWLIALAQASRAAIASMRGHKQEAINLLRDAERAFSALHMAGMAAAARYTMGVSMGDERGQDRIREAEVWLKAEGIVDPRRWVNLMIPGFISEP